MKIREYSGVEEIASSAFSTVYKAKDESDGRAVVLRVIARSLSVNADFRAGFAELAEGIVKLRHPNLLLVHDAGVEGDRCFVVTEPYFEGTLASRIRGYTGEKSAPLIKKLAKVAEYLHQKGFVHLRIRPENVYFNLVDEPILGEIDIAQTLLYSGLEKIKPPEPSANEAQYYCPEQKTGKLDYRADYYQLGLLIHELLAKAAPFQSVEAETLIVMHAYNPAPRLPAHVSAYQDLVDGLLVKDPAKRITHYNDFLALYGEAKSATSTSAKKTSNEVLAAKSTPATKSSSAAPQVIALAATVLLLASVGLYVVKTKQTENAQTIPITTEVVPPPASTPTSTDDGEVTDAEVMAERELMLQKQRQLEEQRRFLAEQERQWLVDEAQKSAAVEESP